MKHLQTSNNFSFHVPFSAERMCDQHKQLKCRNQKVHTNETKQTSLHRYRSRSIDGASRPRVGSEWQKLRRVNSDRDPTTQSRPKWHWVMFGPVKVPSTMDMKDMRDRHVRKNLSEEFQGTKFSKRPWKLLQSLSCKAVETSVVAAVPVAVDPIPNVSF